MRRTTPLLALFPLALALGACGDDGGGSSDAFCNAVEEGEDIEDVGSDDLQDLADDAPGEIRDDVEVLVDFFETVEEEGFEGIDEDAQQEAQEAAENIEDFTRDECDIDLGADESDDSGDDSADDPDEETTTTEAEAEAEAEDDGDDSGSGDAEAGDPEDPPSIDNPTQAEHAEQCFDGDMAACDSLYFETPIGSEEEEYGSTCGGRLEDRLDGLCESTLG